MIQTHGYGWKRQSLDHRDFRFAAPPQVLAALPPWADLRPLMPPVLDQGNASSCTGNAWAVAFDYARKRQGLSWMYPSRLFVYWNERALENTTGQDAGAEIRDGIKTIAHEGVCAESMWPYDLTRLLTQPSLDCYQVAIQDVAVTYYAVSQTASEIMGALAAGYAVVFGFQVFQSFEHMGPDGLVRMPGPNEAPLGGHANCLVGYHHDAAGNLWFDAQNSWGAGFGDRGFVHFPEAFLTNAQLAADFWALEVVSDDTPVPPPVPPTPTPSPYDVGARVRLAMQAEGDSPATNEDYPRRVDGTGAGYSVTQGKSGKTYVYTASTDRVAVFMPVNIV